LNFTIARTAENCVFAFGANNFYQLGKDRSPEPHQSAKYSAFHRSACWGISHLVEEDGVLTPELKQVGIRSVNAGVNSAFVVTNEGQVFACGHAGYGTTDPSTDSKEFLTYTKTLKLNVF